ISQTAISSGKMDIVTIGDPFIDLNYMYDSTQHNFHSTVKTENRKLIFNEKAISIFQERDPTNIKWVMLVLSMFWDLLVGTRLNYRAKMIIISASSADTLLFVIEGGKQTSENPLKSILGYNEVQVVLSPVTVKMSFAPLFLMLDAGAGTAFKDHFCQAQFLVSMNLATATGWHFASTVPFQHTKGLNSISTHHVHAAPLDDLPRIPPTPQTLPTGFSE
ncbi:hypothetical protein U0070_019573, partial [Myodes glareolus]